MINDVKYDVDIMHPNAGVATNNFIGSNTHPEILGVLSTAVLSMA